jgi:hypothetical protein
MGSLLDDHVGEGGVTALANGHYVVQSPNWGGADLGAATWCDGTTATSAEVSASNSLVGTHGGDHVGAGVTALSNGHYVVNSPDWDNDVGNAGAVTWGDGTVGTVGEIDLTNSLVELTVGGPASGYGILALANGNYLVSFPGWDSGGLENLGAVTWGDGSGGTTGVISAANSPSARPRRIGLASSA